MNVTENNSFPKNYAKIKKKTLFSAILETPSQLINTICCYLV